MKRIIKWVATGLAGLLLLVIITGLVLPLIYDTEDLKREVSRRVTEQTGRELEIAGDLGFQVFPWLAIEVNELSLGNAPGFGDAHMARIGNARAGVALLPLLRQELVVDDIVLSGLDLNLVTDAQGRNNWDDLAGEGDGNSGDPGGVGGISSQRIAGLSLDDARIEWRDDQAHTHYRVSGLALSTSAIEPGLPVDLAGSGTLEDLATDGRYDLEMTARLTADTSRQLYALDDLDLQLVDASLGEPLLLSAPSLLLDLAQGTLELDSFTAALGEIRLEGSLAAANLLDTPALGGSLSSNTFDGGALFAALGMEPVRTTDDSALDAISFSAALEGTAEQVGLKGLQFLLDDGTLTGSATIAASGALRFDLDVDRIDLDRYLPVDEGESGTDSAGESLPSGTLEGLDVEGDLRVTTLRLMGLDLDDAELGLRVRDRQLRLHPLTAGIYGGRYQGDIRIDDRGSEPVLSLDERFESVGFGELAQQVAGLDNVSGTAMGHFKASGRGTTADALLGSLDGTLGLDLGEGALEGVDVWYQVRRALGQVTGQPATELTDAGRTVFSRLALAATLGGGQLRMDTLSGDLPFLSLSGDGAINLQDMALDLGVVATVRDVPELDADPLGVELRGRSIPLRLVGTAAAPSVQVDAEALIKSEATNRLLDRVLGSSDPDDGEDAEGDPNRDAARSLIQGILGGASKSEDDEDGEGGD